MAIDIATVAIGDTFDAAGNPTTVEADKRWIIGDTPKRIIRYSTVDVATQASQTVQDVERAALKTRLDNLGIVVNPSVDAEADAAEQFADWTAGQRALFWANIESRVPAAGQTTTVSAARVNDPIPATTYVIQVTDDQGGTPYQTATIDSATPATATPETDPLAIKLVDLLTAIRATGVAEDNKVVSEKAIRDALDALSGDFVGLTDTPSDFTGLALQILRVNAAENAVDAVALAAALVAYDDTATTLPGTPATTQAAIEALKTLVDGLPDQDSYATFAALPGTADNSSIAHVTDASGDPTVTTGWAKYQFLGGTWEKFLAQEDLNILTLTLAEMVQFAGEPQYDAMKAGLVSTRGLHEFRQSREALVVLPVDNKPQAGRYHLIAGATTLDGSSVVAGGSESYYLRLPPNTALTIPGITDPISHGGSNDETVHLQPHPTNAGEFVRLNGNAVGNSAINQASAAVPTVRRINNYFLDDTIGTFPTPTEGDWLIINTYQTSRAAFDENQLPPALTEHWQTIEDPATPGNFHWIAEGDSVIGGNTKFIRHFTERMEVFWFTFSDRRDGISLTQRGRYSLTAEELATGNADWTLNTDPTFATIPLPAGFTRLVTRLDVGTWGYDIVLDWKQVNGEYEICIQDAHNSNAQAGTAGAGVNAYGAVSDIIAKSTATDPQKPTWQALTAYTSGDVVIAQAPAGVAETQDSWYVGDAQSDRPNTVAALDAAEWANWTWTALVPSKQDITVATLADRPDPATLLTGSTVAVANDKSYTVTGPLDGAGTGYSTFDFIPKGTTAEKIALGTVPFNTLFGDETLGKLQKFGPGGDTFNVVAGTKHQLPVMNWPTNTTAGSGLNFKVTEDPDATVGITSLNLPDGTQKQIWIVAQQVDGEAPSAGGAGTLGTAATVRNDAGVISLVSVPNEIRWDNAGSWATLSYNQITHVVVDMMDITTANIQQALQSAGGVWQNAIGGAGGVDAYNTLADLPDPNTVISGTLVTVVNDPAPENSGAWTAFGTDVGNLAVGWTQGD